MSKLDLLTDPWIHTIWLDGRDSEEGVINCLLNSSKIKSVDIPDAVTQMDNISPMILMVMIMARALQPDTNLKLDMFERGEFTVEERNKICTYVDRCQQAGTSFDVFDQEKPFLQVSEEQAKTIFKGKPSPISNLEPFWLSGNNLVFFGTRKYAKDKPVELQYKMTPPQYAASLIRNHMFRTASGGYTATGSVIGQPPLVVIVQGKNLFETLLMMLPESIKNNDIPLWECNGYLPDVSGMIENDSFGFISSLLCPVAYLRYGEFDDSGNVISDYSQSAFKGKKTNKPGDFAELYLRNNSMYMCRMVKKNNKEEVFRASIFSLNTAPWFELASSDAQHMNQIGSTVTAIQFIEALNEEEIIDDNQTFSCKIYGFNASTQSVPNPAQRTFDLQMKSSWLKADTEKQIYRLINMIKSFKDTLSYAMNQYQKEACCHCADSSLPSDIEIAEVCRRYLEDENDKASDWFDRLSADSSETSYQTIFQECFQDCLTAFDEYVPPAQNLLVETKYRQKLCNWLRQRGDKDAE